MRLPDGWVAVVKRDCPTCELVVPVLEQLAAAGSLTVYSQDDPGFPQGLAVVDDTALETSWRLQVSTVPTLLRVVDGAEVSRTEGWLRERWEQLTGLTGLGPDLPDHRPGCGSRSVEWGVETELERRYGDRVLHSRPVELADLEDEIEAMFARGWTDGLPVVPPTEQRVLAMLKGTSRLPDEVVAVVPPDLAPCTVEKVAVNAVLAGCLPEHLPVVLAALEGACTDAFNMHGLLATTYPAGPTLVVNGPVRRRLGMNSGGNALGQGNRANATIGRALQLVVRNVGGGRPGEVDRATQGSPGKLSFCFAEDEEGSPFSPLSASRGVATGTSAVTLFAGAGTWPVVDQLSRGPESLSRSLALTLRGVGHPKLALAFDALLVLSPEHGRVFRDAGWDRDRLLAELDVLLTVPGAELARGVGGIAEGMPPAMVSAGREDVPVPKFRPGGLLVAHAGGTAGLFSTVIPGWVSGATGSEPVTVPVREES
jgi:thiol-disulfide isomerase/thioredoxin